MTRRARLLIEPLDDRCLPSFSPAVSFPVGPNPQAVATADFNNDGRPDLVTANPLDTTISVLLGDGLGGFGGARQFDSCAIAAGYDRASLAIADFNEDGNVDVAVVNHVLTAEYDYYGALTVMPGNGDGTFGAPTELSSAVQPLSVSADDFNADGHVDLLISEDEGGSLGFIRVLLGNGAGGFAPAAPYFMSGSNDAVAVGDVNGDNRLDAVVLLANGWTLLGKGDGTFDGPDPGYSYEFYTTRWARQVALGDFTGEGTLDAIFAGDVIAVHRGQGDGRFDGPINHSANGTLHTDVATGDFNGDGRLDAVTSDADTGTVSELPGNGDGTLSYAGAFAVGSSPAAVAVGDFNGDGRPDVATANAGSNTVSVLLNNGTYAPPPPSVRIRDVTVTEGNTGTASATFTVILSAPSTQPITVAYATGNGTATAGSDYQAVSGTLIFAPGETSKTITVPVIGDRLGEPNETFVVNLSAPMNATIGDGQGVGTILDNEPRISISDVTKAEGRKGKTTLFTFTVTLTVAYDEPVTMSFQTVNGTATTGDNDYIAKTGTLTFAPGETTKTLTIDVKGDSKREANETFSLELFGASSNASFLDAIGLGTIVNDD
jgi:hypothetical protein